MMEVVVRIFEKIDLISIEGILRVIGWADQYVIRQLESILTLSTRATGEVYVAINGDNMVIGFIQVEHHKWNRLSYLHGLVIHHDFRLKGIAKMLVEYVEASSKARGNRGIFVDTPIDNLSGRKFYTAIGFHEAYIMPEFYESGLDGVTFQKFFGRECNVNLDTVR